MNSVSILSIFPEGRIVQKFVGKSEGSSPFRAIYSHTYRRIWGGRSGRAIRFWEIVFWSLLAIYTGLSLSVRLPGNIQFFAKWISYYALVGLTPFTIAALIFRGHASVGSADESLKAIPLSPALLIFPRMLAIFVSWLQLFVPLIILYLVSMNLIANPPLYGLDYPYTRFAVSLLLEFPLKSIFTGEMSEPWYRCAIFIALGVLYSSGFVTLPITWGFWWSSRFRTSAMGFLVCYFLYIIIPAAAIVVSDMNYRVRFGSSGPSLAPGMGIGNVMIVQAISLHLFSILFFCMTCWVLSRRSK